MSSKRRAVVVLSFEDVATMLELPAGLTVEALHHEFMRDALMVKVSGDVLAEVPPENFAPELPRARVYLVDTEPVMDALRKLHYQEDDGFAAGAVCHHCEDPWPCPTMAAAEAEALAHPVAMRRLRVELPEGWRR